MQQTKPSRMINVEHVNPFIESVNDLFTTMLNAKVTRREVKLSKVAMFGNGVVAIIGLSGAAKGTVALGLPAETALAMVNRMVGIDSTEIDETTFDAMAELVNIIAGGAKAKLNKGDAPPISLSLPTVVKGNDYAIESPSWTSWLDVSFDSDLGPFCLRVSFEL